MINPIIRIRGDYCTRCNKERVIECYDKFNRPINYSYLLDRYEETGDSDIKCVNTRELIYMKCKNCNQEYQIDWRKRIPMPLRHTPFVDNFLFFNYNIE